MTCNWYHPAPLVDSDGLPPSGDAILGSLLQDWLPHPFRSLEDALRAQHADLEGLTDFELWQERFRAQWFLAFIDDCPDWARERLERVETERGRRKGRHV